MDQNKTKKVLFVDDDKFLLDMYSVKFTKAGYEVKAADSTELALKILRDGYVPDIILADIVMPGSDGLQFVNSVRKEKLAADAAFIMLTNQGETADIEQARKLGVSSYIVKATTVPSDVLGEVEKVLSNHKTS
ncbi:MAG: response regulator [Patescibacteria group bacterium]|nr:response regulator [Patescibacteria group bacterium]